MSQENQNCLNKLNEKVDREIDRRSYDFLHQLCSFISDYEGQLPNLRDIFRPEAIEWLLTESVNWVDPAPLVKFITNTGYKDEPKVDKDGKLLLNRTTPIHRAARSIDIVGQEFIIRRLFQIYNRFDVNYTDDDGYTHFHIACEYGFVDVVEKFLESGQDPNCIWRETGESPLHLALDNDKREVAKLLLRNGANLILANDEGVTPLHLISEIDVDGGLAEMFFEICRNSQQTVEIDARDDEGKTPLNLALWKNSKKAVETLLRNGADPNLANEEGLTPLHIMSRGRSSEDVAKTFLDISYALNRPVQIDARDNKGNTPLHLALAKKCGSKQFIELLLRRGADPNATNEDGSTPLHSFCRKEYVDDSVVIFFNTNDELNQTVQIDARDRLGRTPLQMAVANIWPDVVDFLLDRGADLSSFVFPDKNQFKQKCEEYSHYKERDSKLRLASSLLLIVEHLEKRGYAMNRSDALKTFEFFIEHELFEKPEDLDEGWFDEEEFAEEAKYIRVFERNNNDDVDDDADDDDNDDDDEEEEEEEATEAEDPLKSLSLYDLIRLRPEEAAKLLTYEDYLESSYSNMLLGFPSGTSEACHRHLCEKLSRGFFHRWAVDSFLELTHYQLPVLCCEIIIKNLMNKDLYHICLATSDQGS